MISKLKILCLIYQFQNLELKVYLVNNFCLLFSKFVFRCCRGLFFQSTTDQIRHPSDPPEAQSPITLVIHGRPNMRKMAQKPFTEPKVQKKRTRPSPLVHQVPVYHAREFWNNLKMRGRMAFNTIFPSSLGAVLEALKGDLPKEGSHFQGLIITLRVVFSINHQTW